MSVIMKGLDVASAMKEVLIEETIRLKEQGVTPCLGILRVGERPDDLAYERSAKNRMQAIGIACEVTVLKEDISQAELEEACRCINQKDTVHGILLFRPLPAHLKEEPIKEIMAPQKDVDCFTDVNAASVFLGDGKGFVPCTAQAVMEMLEFYNIPLEGKKVVVIGRSMVVGKPLAMLLLKEHATVTICHTRTKEIEKVCQEADIIIAAAGKQGMVTAKMVREGTVVVDVGMNVNEEGKLCGDVDFETVEEVASYISPVPRGVGSVTSSVLAKHVVQAAKQQTQS